MSCLMGVHVQLCECARAYAPGRPGARARRTYVRVYASLIFALQVKFTSQTQEIRIALCDAIPDKVLPVTDSILHAFSTPYG